MEKQNSRRDKRQRLRRIGVLTDAQVALGWFVILGLTALVGTIYLSQASRIATTGRRVQLLQNELTDVKRTNAALEQSIAEAQALERLQQEAAGMGFVRAAPDQIEYLVVSNYPAAPAIEPTPATAVAPPVETMKEAVWLAVQDNFSHLMRAESVR